MAKTWTTQPAEVAACGHRASRSPRSTPARRPASTGDKRYGAQVLESGRETLGELQEKLFAASRNGGAATRAARAPGDGHRRQGRHRAPRRRRGRPPGRRAPRVQGADRGGARARLPVAGAARAARAGHDRRLRPLALRGRAHRQGASPRAAGGDRAPLRRDRRVRAASSSRQGTTIVKVMLHISSDEQKQRLADRLDRPEKHWKYNPGDLEERLVWDDYQDAYETAIRRTSTEAAPWFVVPADRKWYARVAVQQLLIDALASAASRVARGRLRRRGGEGAARRQLSGAGRSGPARASPAAGPAPPRRRPSPGPRRRRPSAGAAPRGRLSRASTASTTSATW